MPLVARLMLYMSTFFQSVWIRGIPHLPAILRYMMWYDSPVNLGYASLWEATKLCVDRWVTHQIPSGYLTVCHGKSPFLIGKPSISMGHGFHGYVSHRGYASIHGLRRAAVPRVWAQKLCRCPMTC